jgi:hypothetical protein
MKASTLTFLTIAFLIIVAILTNPNPERHKEVVKNKIYKYLQKPILEEATNVNSRGEDAISALDILLGSTFVDGVIDNLVSTDNYLLFSTTNLSYDGKTKTIGYGVFGNVYIAKELEDAMNEALNNVMKEDKRKKK